MWRFVVRCYPDVSQYRPGLRPIRWEWHRWHERQRDDKRQQRNWRLQRYERDGFELRDRRLWVQHHGRLQQHRVRHERIFGVRRWRQWQWFVGLDGLRIGLGRWRQPLTDQRSLELASTTRPRNRAVFFDLKSYALSQISRKKQSRPVCSEGINRALSLHNALYAGRGARHGSAAAGCASMSDESNFARRAIS
jgi:hypothetical protein